MSIITLLPQSPAEQIGERVAFSLSGWYVLSFVARKRRTARFDVSVKMARFAILSPHCEVVLELQIYLSCTGRFLSQVHDFGSRVAVQS
jgi:hypothetical protein